MPAKTIVLFQGGRPEASAAAATAGRGQSQPGKHLYLYVDTIAQRSHNILPSCLAGQREERGGEGAGEWRENGLHASQRVVFFSFMLNVKTALTLASNKHSSG